MNGVQRANKQQLAKGDDSCKNNKKDCKKHHETCEVEVSKGKCCCRRQAVTHWTVVCDKEITHKYHWGYQETCKGKWEPTSPEDIPKHCKKKDKCSDDSH